MFRTLQSRLWLSYLLLIAGVIGISLCGLLVYLVRNPALTREAALELQIATRTLEAADRLDDLRRLQGGLAPAQIQTYLERADQNLGVRILLLEASSRTVIADSRQEQGPKFSPEALRALVVQEKIGIPRLARDAAGEGWLYILRPQPAAGSHEYLLMVAQPRPRPTLRSLLNEEILGPFTLAAGSALVLALLLGTWIAGWTLAPLQRMTQAAHLVASGTYQPIPLEGPSEVQELAQSFNEMADRVQASQQSQREFVANVSHDLKTPLTSIQGFAQAILDGTANTPEALQQSAQVIYAESARMHRMVLDLLDLARLDAGIAALERAPLDLAALLHGIVARLEPQAQQNAIQLQATIAPEIQELSGLIGDHDRLSQVFTNLLDNALKFTPAQGRVEVIARLEGALAVVQVVDSGTGIAPDELPRIFDRFYQAPSYNKARSSSRGVGLGLAIVRQIIQAHGGSIEAYNNAGAGSTFVVKLPLARPDDSTLASRRNLIKKG